MNISGLFSKPELVWRPGFVWQRLTRRQPPAGASVDFKLPWNLPLRITPSETVGRHIWTFGVFDIAVCELLWRLCDPGESALDVGANLGQMTGLLARRVGRLGEVTAFEPHPEINARLRQQVAGWRRDFPGLGKITTAECALSNLDGTGTLYVPSCFAENNGLSTIAAPSAGAIGCPIEFRRLDRFLPAGKQVGVMKLDVEGAELSVLEGADELLARKGIRDLVFEDHDPFPSQPAQLLERHGYTVFSIRLNLFGPIILPGRESCRALRPWDSPSFLATTEPERAIRRLTRRGWHCLRPGSEI